MSPASDARLGDLIVSVGRPSVAHYPAGSSFGPRTVDRFEFLWVLAGSGGWECGRRRHLLGPGTLLLARPGMVDRFRWDTRRPSRIGYLGFALADGHGDPDTWPVVRATGPDDPLRGLARYLLWLGSRDPQDRADRIRDTLGLMLTVFVRGPLPDDTVDLPLPAALGRVVDHVRAAWSAGPLRPLSRTELARAGTMSAGHLSRMFREHCGVGAVAAFELLRLMRAETLLRRSNLSVRTIAEVCGFADPYHFSHRFKAAYGVSPRSLRDGAPATLTDPGDRPGVRLLVHRVWGHAGP